MPSRPKHPSVLLTGDVCLENLEFLDPSSLNLPGSPGKETSPAFQFEEYPSVCRYSLEGGAWLLGKVLSHLQPDILLQVPVLQPREKEGPPLLVRASVISRDGRENRFLITGVEGYYRDLSARNIKYPADGKGQRMTIIYEEGNHFKARAENLPQNLEKDTFLLYKMSGPVNGNPVWNALSPLSGLDPEKLVVIIPADDLRKEKEVSISRSISWEATATDLAFHLNQSIPLASLFHSAHLIVLFDFEGALYYQNYRGHRTTLLFDPANLEGQFRKQFPGGISGKDAVFTAILADFILREDPKLIDLTTGIRKALGGMREWLKAGYSIREESVLLPLAALGEKPGHQFSEVSVAHPRSLFEPDPGYWTILDAKVTHTRRLVAENIVRSGDDPILRQVPEIRFGKILRAMDRSEIERLSGIWKLIAEYMDHPSPGKPLSLAVFGTPGSGKSFSINQIAEQIDSRRIQKIVFNLSQFREYEELAAAFHRVRNVNLAGKIPLVFFDEFDADRLKWLKFFLAPMQDGEFLEGGNIYNLGAAIFVFAGGTCATFEQFSASQNNGNPADQGKARELKLPDFISRLRGFINIKGPNPVDDRFVWDHLHEQEILWRDENFIIRRAKLIRSMLERVSHAGGLFDKDKKKLKMDSGVLRALLLVPEYKHGIRSIEAILEMSRLSGKRFFDKAALPPEDQLALHVDKEIFKYLLEKERFLLPADHPSDFIARENEVVRNIAAGIHREYIRHRKVRGQAYSVPEDFEELKDLDFAMYLSNIHAAREIPEKLMSVGVGIREKQTGESYGKFPVFSEEEIGRLARWEHQRWYQERSWAGRQLQGTASDKVHPWLVDWGELPDEVKERDYEAIRSLPFLLEENGLVMYRMEEMEEIDEQLIESIARAIHGSYAARKKAVGESTESFDRLRESLRLSNMDHALHIPTKLKKAGYAIRKVLPGENVRLVRFSEEETESMAEWEHRRWCWDKWRQGYIWKPGEKDEENRTHPDLIPYGQLSEKVKDYDRKPVREIPALLKEAGYEIFKQQ